MSHIVTIAVELRDLAAIQAACQRLKIEEPVFGTNGSPLDRGWCCRTVAKKPLMLFAGIHKRNNVTRTIGGRSLLPAPARGFPIVCDLSTGTIHYDNYQGHWGDQKHLDKFVQTYSVEKTKLEARCKGYSVFEQPLHDGSIKLTINLGGAV